MSHYDQTMVSVSCLCYNHKSFIRRTLEGFVMQKTDFPFEVIIHDDASTDGSQEIIREFQERYPNIIKPILQTENQFSKGRRVTAEFILPRVQGKYIAFCEGDDYWSDPEKLQLQVDGLESHPNCSFSVHNTRKVDVQGSDLQDAFPPVKVKPGVIPAEEYVHLELGERKWMFQLSSLLMPVELICQYQDLVDSGYVSRFYKVGDQPMILLCLTKGDAWYVDRDMSCYTVASGGFMSTEQTNRAFRARVHEGFVNGLKVFDEFSNYRFTKDVNEAVSMHEVYRRLAGGDYSVIRDRKYAAVIQNMNGKERLKYRLYDLIPILAKLRGED